MEVLITGATSGIGTAMAVGLIQDGHRLHLHGRSESKLAVLKATVGLFGSAIETYIADFEDVNGITRMGVQLESNTPHLDLLINNAFGSLDKPLHDCQPDELSAFIQISVGGTAQVVRSVLGLLRKAPSPRIMNIVADWGFPMHNIMTGPSPYISAKYAVHGLGAALQTELGAFGIRTTNLCPGVVAAEAEYGLGDDEFRATFGTSAIHPRTLVDAVRFVLAAPHAHVRTIVISPPAPDYNGL